MEIEAKYIAPDQRFAGFLELDILGDYSLGAIREKCLTDRYMDTERRDVLEAGYALRTREEDGKWLVTVKALGNVEHRLHAVHRRDEYEIEIQPDKTPEQWPDGEARDIVISLVHSHPLRELCVIRQHRVTRTVHRDKRLVGVLSLDTVDMESGGRFERTYEVEIELGKDGTLEDLWILDEVLRIYGLRPEPRSKFERAMALLC